MEVSDQDLGEASSSTGTRQTAEDAIQYPNIPSADIPFHQPNLPAAPIPVEADIFREHNYSNKSRARRRRTAGTVEMGEAENEFYQANVGYAPNIRAQYANNFTRTISNMAFKYSCVDVNYTASSQYQTTHGVQ